MIEALAWFAAGSWLYPIVGRGAFWRARERDDRIVSILPPRSWPAIVAIRSALIDDCALAGRLKATGPIWIGLGRSVLSLRSSPDFGSLRRMVTRSAYAQLGYSSIVLLATVVAMVCIFVLPLGLAIAAPGRPALLGAVAYPLMVVSFVPMLRFYRLSPLWGLAPPPIAAAYSAWTVESAVYDALGRGGMWKGRTQPVPMTTGAP